MGCNQRAPGLMNDMDFQAGDPGNMSLIGLPLNHVGSGHASIPSRGAPLSAPRSYANQGWLVRRGGGDVAWTSHVAQD